MHCELNRPSRLNAMSFELIAELHNLLDQLRSSLTVRVLVLSGSGKAFCAGADLKAARGDGGGARWFAKGLSNQQHFSGVSSPRLAVGSHRGAELQIRCMSPNVFF